MSMIKKGNICSTKCFVEYFETDEYNDNHHCSHSVSEINLNVFEMYTTMRVRAWWCAPPCALHMEVYMDGRCGCVRLVNFSDFFSLRSS